MKFYFKAACVLLAVFFLSGCRHAIDAKKQAAEGPGAVVIDGFSHPAAVVAEPGGRIFYVSDLGAGAGQVKDGDGFISKVSADGKILVRNFLPKDGVLDAPRGMVIIMRTIYVADVDRVVAFDLHTREKVFELEFAGEKTAFLNGLALLANNVMAVSSTDTGRIYLMTIGVRPRFRVLQKDVAGAAGLVLDRKSRRLFVAGFGDPAAFDKGGLASGRLGVMTFGDGRQAQYMDILKPMGALTGVEMLSNGMLIVSDWVAPDRPGMVRVFDPHTGHVMNIKLSREIRGPSNFHFDANTGNLWIPLTLEGKVMIEKIRN